MDFELAGGSIPGFHHTQRGRVLVGRNNQDSWHLYRTKKLSVALVADGCGSKPYSEVGSFLLLRLLAPALERAWFSSQEEAAPFELRLRLALQFAGAQTLSSLETLSRGMLSSCGGIERGVHAELISDCFLSTIVGVFMADDQIGFFGLGDGVLVINGEMVPLGPFEGNEPPYLAYSLFETRWTSEQLGFKIHRVLNAGELDSFLIGTDGVLDLAAVTDQTLPGSSSLIGPLDQFWTEDRFFSRAGIRNRLARIQSRQPNPSQPQNGIDEARLPDDTTFIVGRRIGREGLCQRSFS